MDITHDGCRLFFSFLAFFRKIFECVLHISGAHCCFASPLFASVMETRISSTLASQGDVLAVEIAEEVSSAIRAAWQGASKPAHGLSLLTLLR
jgi:hypothetical protein